MKDAVDVIATRKARGWAKEGQRKTLTAKEARVVVLTKQAEYAPKSEQPVGGKRARGYERRDMQAAPAPVTQPAGWLETKTTGDGEAQ